MTYAVTYGMLINGTVTAGPKAGTVLTDIRQEVIDAMSEAEAVAKAESYADKFVGTIAIYARQYQEKGPGRKAGFVYIDGLATVTHG